MEGRSERGTGLTIAEDDVIAALREHEQLRDHGLQQEKSFAGVFTPFRLLLFSSLLQ